MRLMNTAAHYMSNTNEKCTHLYYVISTKTFWMTQVMLINLLSVICLQKSFCQNTRILFWKIFRVNLVCVLCCQWQWAPSSGEHLKTAQRIPIIPTNYKSILLGWGMNSIGAVFLQTYILKASVLGVQTPQNILHFPQKDWLKFPGILRSSDQFLYYPNTFFMLHGSYSRIFFCKTLPGTLVVIQWLLW